MHSGSNTLITEPVTEPVTMPCALIMPSSLRQQGGARRQGSARLQAQASVIPLASNKTLSHPISESSNSAGSLRQLSDLPGAALLLCSVSFSFGCSTRACRMQNIAPNIVFIQPFRPYGSEVVLCVQRNVGCPFSDACWMCCAGSSTSPLCSRSMGSTSCCTRAP